MQTESQLYASYFDQNKQLLETEFAHLLHFKTISADSSSLEACRACASWIKEKLSKIGFQTSLWGDSFPPTVFGHFDTGKDESGSPKPTLLIYNHYDVQPVDPIEKWNSDPFTAKFEGDKIIARGAQDNKGQLFYVLTALEATYKQHGTYPCSIKILVEGEEESGSAHLPNILNEHSKELQADYAMIIDLGMQTPTAPAITLGTRGLLALTLEVTGTHEDLHSGCHGGLAYNPLHALVNMLSQARTEHGSIAIPGFYDGIEQPSQSLLDLLSWSFSSHDYEKCYGTPPTGGEVGYLPLERNWLRPTLEINGIVGGYGGSGSKTVIPSSAVAKITCRLVPGQNSKIISERIKCFFESITPKGITTKVTLHEGSGAAVRANPNSPCIRILSQSMQEVYNRTPDFHLEGASIPIVPKLKEASNADIIMWGLGLQTDKIHAPNEEFDFDRIRKGYLIVCRILDLLGKTDTK